MAQGRLRTCLDCGLTLEAGFHTTDGKCRVCIEFFGDPVLHLLPDPPKWTATPKPKYEKETHLWWIFKKNKWVVLAPYEYPEQQMYWLKKQS